MTDTRLEAVASFQRWLAEVLERARTRCIHGGECGDPCCPWDGSDEQ